MSQDYMSLMGSRCILAAGIGLVLVTVCALDVLTSDARSAYVWLMAVHSAFYLAAVWLVLNKRIGQGGLLIILAVAIVLRVLVVPAPQSLTTDAYRYVWDGRVQLAGFSPYLWVPASPELSHLRDLAIYPNIYLKEIAVTVYPPVAQLMFALGVLISDSILGIKIVMAVFEAITIWALLKWLQIDGLPPERIIIYAWHPLPVWELVGQAHIDAVAIGLMMLGILLACRKAQFFSGVLFAAAACTKFFPLALLPALWRRWDWRMPVAVMGTFILCYLPYAWFAGTGVVGFTAQLAEREGYTAGYGFHVIWLARDFAIADPPASAYIAFAVCILVYLALRAAFDRGRDEIRPVHLVTLSAAFIWLTSPHHVWYFAWLVPLLCRHLSVAALAMTLICLLRYLPLSPPLVTASTVYLATFAIPLLLVICERLATRPIRHRAIDAVRAGWAVTSSSRSRREDANGLRDHR